MSLCVCHCVALRRIWPCGEVDIGEPRHGKGDRRRQFGVIGTPIINMFACALCLSFSFDYIICTSYSNEYVSIEKERSDICFQ